MRKLSIKQYIPTFFIALIFCGFLEVVRHAQGTYFFTAAMAPTGEPFTIFLYKGKEFFVNQYVLDWVFLVCFALGFVLLFFLIDLATGKVKTKKKEFEEMDARKFDEFVDSIGGELNKVKLFSVEDFRHFRENTKLQDCLKKLYKIYLNGETENSNYFLILRKFEKGSTERSAIEYLVTFTENLREKNKEEIAKYNEVLKERDAYLKSLDEKKAARKNKKNKQGK